MSSTAASPEDDYMSDAVLQQCADTRPGLLPTHLAKQYKNAQKHKDSNEKNKGNFKPRKELEKEKREEGLKEVISSSNKGFALLQKMGYKPGMAIGKQGTGRKEPVPVEIKLGRGGLGRETDLKRKQEQKTAMRTAMVAKRQKMEVQQRGSFLQSMSERFSSRQSERDLRKSQKVCEQLDSEMGIEKPAEKFFWPEHFLPNDCQDESLQPLSDEPEYDNEIDDQQDQEEEEDVDVDDDEESEEFSDAEKLEILTLYLRNKFRYCVWCGIRFQDKTDMQTSCPGNTAEAHDE